MGVIVVAVGSGLMNLRLTPWLVCVAVQIYAVGLRVNLDTFTFYVLFLGQRKRREKIDRVT